VFAYRFKLYIERHGYSGTGNLVVRRTDFEKIGPFGGIQVAEDMDWGARACAAAYRFHYVPDMIVFHPARTSIRELFFKWDRHTQHYLNMARGGHAWKSRWIVRSIALLASPMRDWLSVVSTNRISGASPRLKAFLVLIAVRSYRAWKMLSLLRYSKEVIWNRSNDISRTNANNDPT
jgi:GT2 family glycosyltransferase